jgi:hypothetical protein
MYYEINVSFNDMHYFATAERSLTTEAAAIDLYNHMCRVFPPAAGYELKLREVTGLVKEVVNSNALLYRGYTVYKDQDDCGESFTVVAGPKGTIGSYLADDPFLKDVLRAGARVKDGIDNRTPDYTESEQAEQNAGC